MDAFSISPIASSKGMSIIFAKASDLQPSIKGLLEGKSKNNVYIAGGSDVVSDWYVEGSNPAKDKDLVLVPIEVLAASWC